MSSFAPQVSRIKGISDKRRLPRLGKLRLGFKVKRGTSEFPAELPFFLLPDEVGKLYGFKTAEEAVERAKAMGATRQDVLTFIQRNYMRLAEQVEVMFPINDIATVFPTSLKWYGGAKGVKCMGDGEFAYRTKSDLTAGDAKVVEDEPEDAKMIRVHCPCKMLKSDENPKGECTHRGHLLCLIPKVNMGGVWQVDLGSYNSIIDINSGLAYTEALIGRFSLVPLILRRTPIQTHHGDKKQTHFTLQLICSVPIDQLENLKKDTSRILMHQTYLLPPPEDINPTMDGGDVLTVEYEEVKTTPAAPEAKAGMALPAPQTGAPEVTAEASAPPAGIVAEAKDLFPGAVVETMEIDNANPDAPTPQEQKIIQLTEKIRDFKEKMKPADFKAIRDKYPKKTSQFAMQDWVMLAGELDKRFEEASKA